MEQSVESTGAAILAALGKQGYRIAFAESMTAGYAVGALARTPGVSAVLRGAIVAYDVAAKRDLLGVDAAHARSVNGVSERVAREMAEGIRRRLGVEVGAAATGYAEPWEDQQSQAWIALSIPGQETVARHLLLSELPDRESVRRVVAETLLRLIREQLARIDHHENPLD